MSEQERVDKVERISVTAAHLLNECRDDIDFLYADQLKHLLRKVERFAPLNVSQAAHQKAERLGIGDLRHYHYRHQNQFDKGRLVFHWEHVATGGDLFRAMMALPPGADPVEVASVLRQANIAWILKTENVKLDKNGFRSRRGPEPWRAYEKVDIQLLYRACGICVRDGSGRECATHQEMWPTRLGLPKGARS